MAFDWTVSCKGHGYDWCGLEGGRETEKETGKERMKEGEEEGSSPGGAAEGTAVSSYLQSLQSSEAGDGKAVDDVLFLRAGCPPLAAGRPATAGGGRAGRRLAGARLLVPFRARRRAAGPGAAARTLPPPRPIPVRARSPLLLPATPRALHIPLFNTPLPPSPPQKKNRRQKNYLRKKREGEK